MAGTFTPTGSYSNLSRLELEQLRKADFYAGGKALTVGDSALPPEGVVGAGSINAEPFYTNPSLTISDIHSVSPPGTPGDYLQKNLDIYPNGSTSGVWYGPTVISSGFQVSSTSNTTSPNIFADVNADFVTDGVQAGDVVLIEDPVHGNPVGIVGSVDSATQLTMSSVSGTWGTHPVPFYQVIRPGAAQLFAVPGSGPVGQEQTFMFVDPASTLHTNVGPTVDDINFDRIRDIISPRFATSTAQDRADAVYPSPAPFASATNLGYRVVLYPDNGTGTGPDLTKPISSLTPVIDPAIPAADQRMTIDYTAGIVRFSCAPALGGDIKVAGGVNAITGRLNLYAVFWAHEVTNVNSVSRLYVPPVSNTGADSAKAVYYASPSWQFLGENSSIILSGNSPNNQILRGEIVEIPQPSIIEKINRASITIGDGSNTHGDWNGSTAIQTALNALFTRFPTAYTSVEVFVKKGTYQFTTSTLTIPANVEVIIRGESKSGVVIQMLSPAECITVTSGGQLRCESLTIQGFNGTGFGILVNGSIRFKDCAINDTPLRFVNPTPLRSLGSFNFVAYADICIVEDCEIEASNQSSIFAYPIQIFQSTATPSKGYRFRNCSITGCGTGEAIMTVSTSASPAVGTTVSGISFEKCRIAVYACSSTSATAISRASGVFYVDPSGSTDAFTVDDVAFDDCIVDSIANGLANTILMHCSPLAFDAAATTSRAIIKKVRIRGGTWSVPSSRGTDFTPFFLQCLKPVVENVTFVGGGTDFTGFGSAPGFRGRGFYTHAQRLALRGSTSAIDSTNGYSNAFCTIAASGTAIESISNVSTLESGLIVKGIYFTNQNRKGGGASVVCLVGPSLVGGPADVDGVTVHANAGTSGVTANIPVSYILVVPGGVGNSNRGTHGSFRRLVFHGNQLAANTDQWCLFAGATNTGGIIGFMGEGKLTLEQPGIWLQATPDGSCVIDLGIYQCNDWTNTYSGLGPYKIIEPHIVQTRRAIWITPANLGGGSLSFGPYEIRGLRYTSGGSTTNAPDFGIIMAFSGGSLLGVNIYDSDMQASSLANANQFTGISIQGSGATTVWQPYYASHICNNRIVASYGGNAVNSNSLGIAIVSSTVTSNEPAVTILGNHCMALGSANARLGIRCQRQNGQALSGGTTWGGAAFGGYIGVETSRPDAFTYNYANTGPLLKNHANLVTP